MPYPSEREDLLQRLDQGGYVLVVEGAALGYTLSEEFSKDLLLRISMQCKAVIYRRISPFQKALIVHLINDGLAGEEGLQAVNASDPLRSSGTWSGNYSSTVTGSYYQNWTMILGFFYKETVNIGYLFFFQIYCAWSTTQALDYIYLLLKTAFWTVAAVVGVGIFDRDISDRFLTEVPELFRRGREYKYFGMWPSLLYILHGGIPTCGLPLVKPRGLNTARKQKITRRDNRWADKQYKKRALGNFYKSSPTGGSSQAKGIVLEKKAKFQGHSISKKLLKTRQGKEEGRRVGKG
ncbi:hypothetical protein CF326_g6126 [Tilletia indica]|nr:hypothetical protein CF326_g6126 [Tilletia indica]